jgi:hypothetical protein
MLPKAPSQICRIATGSHSRTAPSLSPKVCKKRRSHSSLALYSISSKGGLKSGNAELAARARPIWTHGRQGYFTAKWANRTYNASTVERFNEAFNRHDANVLAKMLTEDTAFEDTSPAPDGRRLQGKAGVVERCRAIPQLRQALEGARRLSRRGPLL